MKTTEITENNKLIAEFMGVKYEDGWYYSCELKRAGLPFSPGAEGNGASELKFHCSWDWLMPVVEKIESLDWDIQIRSVHRRANFTNQLNHFCDISRGFYNKQHENFSAVDNSKIRATWFTVMAFIKWYNQQNQQ